MYARHRKTGKKFAVNGLVLSPAPPEGSEWIFQPEDNMFRNKNTGEGRYHAPDGRVWCAEVPEIDDNGEFTQEWHHIGPGDPDWQVVGENDDERRYLSRCGY